MIKRFLTYFASTLLAATSLSAGSVLTLSSHFTDSTIVMPSSLETNVDKMMENWYLQNYIIMDRQADLKSDPGVTDEVIMQRLAAIPSEVEMPYNELVRSYIDMYTQRRRQLVENMLGMSIYYLPIFEEALYRNGVPLELKYLPVIESAMNPQAVSKAGAVGLWQFMLPTARGLGLEINTLVDERKDPYKSSEAAARYLRELYDLFGDWSLAIAGYNCGPGNITKALKRAGDGDGKKRDFWDIYYYLPQETRGYFPGFIAANYVMTYYPEHGISPALARKPIITDTIHVTRQININQIAEVLNIPIDEIRTLNPQYNGDWIPGNSKPYSLALPSKQIYSYLMSEDSIANHNLALYGGHRIFVDPSGAVQTVREDGDYIITEETVWHKVKKGESLTSIAKKYGTTVAKLKQANGGINSVRSGQTIKIMREKREKKPTEPILAQNTTTTDSTATASAATSDNYALSELQAQGIEIPSNGSVSANAGEAAKPAATEKPVETKKPAAPAQSQQPKYVTVKKGDTLSAIARNNRTTVAKIKQLNGLKNDNIRAGQKLRVK